MSTLRNEAGLFWFLPELAREKLRGYSGSWTRGRCAYCNRYAKIVAVGDTPDRKGVWYGVDCMIHGESVMDGAWYESGKGRGRVWQP